MIRRYVGQTDGRAFVLFTSYEMMKRAAAALDAVAHRAELGALFAIGRDAAEPDARGVQEESAFGAFRGR